MNAFIKIKQTAILMVIIFVGILLSLIAINTNNYIYRGIVSGAVILVSSILFKQIIEMSLSKKVFIIIAYWIVVYATFYTINEVI